MPRLTRRLVLVPMLLALAACAARSASVTPRPADASAEQPVTPQSPPPPAQAGIDTEAVFRTLSPPTLGPSAPYQFKELRTPPRPNEQLVAFPPAEQLAPPKTPPPPVGPLKVSRKQPEGTQEIVGTVNVTFNQPMVPLASVEDLKKHAVPLQIEPLPPGRFRWLGTSTAEFEPEGRMPFATAYTARVPAGVQSATGGTLASEVSWTFETPRPIVQFVPAGMNEAVPNQLIELSFNQAVSADEVRKALVCTAAGKPFGLVASEPETDPFKDDTTADVAERKKLFRERHVFFRPAKELSLDSEIRCTLPKGFRGAEGPLTTTKDQGTVFRTYAPLKLMELQCGWGSQCLPQAGIFARFNNQLDPEQDLSKLFHVEPAVPELSIDGSGNYVHLNGLFEPSSTYHVRIDAELTDVHKQRLGHPETKDIHFTESEPALNVVGAPHAILEAKGPRLVPLHTTNISEATLRWFRLEPGEIPSTLRLVSNFWRPGDPFAKLTAAGQKKLSFGKHDNKDVGRGIALDDLLGKGAPGLLLLDVEAPELARRYKESPTHRAVIVQVTDLALTVHVSNETAIALVTSLSTGRPVSGATVSLVKGSRTVVAKTTDARGIAELGPNPDKSTSEWALFTATLGADTTVLTTEQIRTGDYSTTYFMGSQRGPGIVSTLFTDRQPYKPGETVHLTGVVRAETRGMKGRIEPLPAGAAVTYTVQDNRWIKTHDGRIEIGPMGMFSVDLAIAPDAFLGQHRFIGQLENAHGLQGSLFTTFEVQEYRTPEYKVSVDPGASTYFVNDALNATVHGDYYFGGAMSGAQVNWNVSRAHGSFVPPGNSGFIFGDQNEPHPFFEEGWGRRFRPESDQVAHGTGALDMNGTLPIHATLDPAKLKGPVSFTVFASVTDANRQQISANSTFVAHAGGLYPGLKIDRGVVKEGESVEVQAIAADIDGHRHDPPARVELAERKWEKKKQKAGWGYEETEKAVGGCDFNWSHKLEEAASCRLKLPSAGNFVLRVRAKDDKGRENVTTTMVWAYGKGWSPWYRQQEQATVEIVADKPEHAPGETAQLLIRSPFPRSVGILAVQREGLIEYRALDFEGAAHGEAIPLTEEELPNVNVTVSLVRGRISAEEAGALEGDPDDLGRPMYAGGSLLLPISKKGHAIDVAVTTDRETIAPGAKLGLRVQTKDSEGHPIAARLAIAIVDEGVLSLLGYSLPNPLDLIFSTRPGEGGDLSAVPLVLQREKKLTQVALNADSAPRKSMRYKDADAGGSFMFAARAAASPAPAAAGDMMMVAEKAEMVAAPPTMTARTFFASTAYFSAAEKTDATGAVQLTIPMPENLTRYRVMVVAVGDGERFGKGDGAVQVQKPLLVRPSLPRFLNLGDKFLASAVVNNQTPGDLWVDVGARAANGAADAKRQRVFIRAGQAQEVAFEATAGVPGKSRWQFAAVAVSPELWNDAAELDVPVELPATAEAFATYGTTENSVLQPLQLPSDALPDFGGLEVSMSSTALTGLTDAVAYLADYPYECVEQTASRILPYIVLKKIITDFHLKNANTELERDKVINTGLERLWSKQRPDGGFGYWADSRESYLFISSWAAYVILRAKEAGYTVEVYRLNRLMGFLQQRLRYPRQDLGEHLDFNSQALAALVLQQSGSNVLSDITRIFEKRTELAIFGSAWLLEAAHEAEAKDIEKELNRIVQSAAVQKPSSAHFAEAQTESLRLLMHSNQRTDAIVLTALLHVSPTDPLIPKIVHGLNESRDHGRWDTTQSNAWATTAMSDYYAAFEKETPRFDANIFIGNGFVGSGHFSGRETKILTEKVPMSAVASQSKSDLTLAKEGQGRLYYRLGLRYAPKDLKLAAEEQGFTVTRTYLPMEDAPDSVVTDPDGSVRIKAGADVRVRLEIVVSDRANFVAVDDPLPAGLEAVNTAFLTNRSARVMNAETDDVIHRRGWWWWSPFNHTEMRDERVALFADQLPAGVYTHTYVARATTKGTFQVPPARAFEMYEPENFGRTASTVVAVQ